MQDLSATITAITREVLSQTCVPRATYRFQFSPSFTFYDALKLVDYLNELGISDCYASPIFRARVGSTHGYDVCDHNQISQVLGGEEGLNALCAALRERGMSLVIDIVPNHMGIGDRCNGWWMDVLENGPASDYASHFDIEWETVKPELRNKVLLPILGDQYGVVLENGEFRLSYEDGAFFIHYYDHLFPVAPGSYHQILEHPLDWLTETLGQENDHLLEYQSILTAIGYLPPRVGLEQEKRIERNREKEVIKRRIAHLVETCPDVQQAIEQAVQAFNDVDNPASFDLLENLINEQSYRLAYWRVAAEEINYRRFFDVNDLAAIRTEDAIVFHDTHQLVFRLITEGKISGLRLDHIDGLFDPAAYLQQLHEGYVLYQVRSRLVEIEENIPDEETLARLVSIQLQTWLAEQHQADHAAPARWPVYVVAEKILGEDELLPPNWAVHGTTGYDFLIATGNLFVNNHNEQAFTTIYQQFTGRDRPFEELVNTNKKMIMLVSMDSEIYALSHQLERLAERNRRYRDFTLNTLTFAIREVIACLSVYRTYTTRNKSVLIRDRHYLEAAVAEAKRRNPRTAETVFDFLLEILLLIKLPDFKPEDRDQLLQWVMKFQQVSGPVMAKGVEDTTFYVYNRLVSLNEVGGHPNHFGTTTESFHTRNSNNQRFWPHTMLASSTHDTKRSEDVRMRIHVLSELPMQWEAALQRWHKRNAWKTVVKGNTVDTVDTVDGDDEKHHRLPVPDRNDEYLLYQTLVGTWPFTFITQAPSMQHPEWNQFCDRIAAYMQKATKEAKVHTSWVQPNHAYDDGVRDFIYHILSDDDFLADMRSFVQEIAGYGIVNSLAHTLLKLTAPGVPDIYQGCELWDLSLVDPDNRRPVDYDCRRNALMYLKQAIAEAGDDLRPLVQNLLETCYNGHVKLYTITRVLTFRREHAPLFAHGTYAPLESVGLRSDHVCAFRRGQEGEAVIVVVPRLVTPFARPPHWLPVGDVWGNTCLTLLEEDNGYRYRNRLTEERVTVTIENDQPVLRLSDIFASFPVALLERMPAEEG